MDQTGKRQALILLLQNYHPNDPAEITFKWEMLSFINKHPDCFERSLAIGHITASAMLLNKDRTKALLMHHAKLGRWCQLGGHCDGDPNVLAVAVREAQEESGIGSIVPLQHEIFDIDIYRVPARGHEQEHNHYDVRFLLAVDSDEEIVQNQESKELRWIEKDLAKLPTDSPSVIRMFKKWVDHSE